MKVILLGADVVGRSIARHLLKEGHSVVMIDDNPQDLARAADTLDVQTLFGLGSRPALLETAGARDADILIAVTKLDEVNMVACQMAYSIYDIPRKIARVRDASYLALTGSHVYTNNNMPVDVIVSPEVEVAQAILRATFVPGSFDAYSFDDGHLQMVGTHVGKGCTLLHQKLEEWDYEKVPMKILAIYRRDRLIVPTSQDHLEEGDEIFILARQLDVAECMAQLGSASEPVKNVFVIGGGNVGLHIAEVLERLNINARVLEFDVNRAAFLAERLHKVTVLQGDALDSALLEEENIEEADIVLCVTSNDQTNILASILAQQFGVQHVITLLNNDGIMPIVDGVGLKNVIAPQQITVSQVLQSLRRENIINIHTVRDGAAEVLEIEIQPESPLLGGVVGGINLPSGCQFGAVIKANGRVMLNEIYENLQVHDRVVLFVTNEKIKAVEKLF